MCACIFNFLFEIFLQIWHPAQTLLHFSVISRVSALTAASWGSGWCRSGHEGLGNCSLEVLERVGLAILAISVANRPSENKKKKMHWVWVYKSLSIHKAWKKSIVGRGKDVWKCCRINAEAAHWNLNVLSLFIFGLANRNNLTKIVSLLSNFTMFHF